MGTFTFIIIALLLSICLCLILDYPFRRVLRENEKIANETINVAKKLRKKLENNHTVVLKKTSK